MQPSGPVVANHIVSVGGRERGEVERGEEGESRGMDKRVEISGKSKTYKT